MGWASRKRDGQAGEASLDSAGQIAERTGVGCLDEIDQAEEIDWVRRGRKKHAAEKELVRKRRATSASGKGDPSGTFNQKARASLIHCNSQTFYTLGGNNNC